MKKLSMIALSVFLVACDEQGSNHKGGATIAGGTRELSGDDFDSNGQLTWKAISERVARETIITEFKMDGNDYDAIVRELNILMEKHMVKGFWDDSYQFEISLEIPEGTSASFEISNASLETILEIIKRQTGVKYFYTDHGVLMRGYHMEIIE